jgi:beta-lactamase superfamily II metal-dependent hydrolase
MAAKKSNSTNHHSSNGTGLRIRMYHVGFGDFFLVSVPAADGPEHILIDCGVTPGTTHKGDLGTIKDAVAHMAQETGGKLALVIMTHRHMDHIIGFSRCADIFKPFQVDAVWMPYWESEYDADAKKFQAELTALAFNIQQHLALSAGANEEVDEMLAMLRNATGVDDSPGMAAAGPSKSGKGKGGGSNAASLQILKSGFGVKPQYYARGDQAKLPAKLAAAGLTAEILGPPPAETATTFMKLTDLKKGVGQYLGADGGGNGKTGKFDPFGAPWHADAGEYPASAFHEWIERSSKAAPELGNRRLEDAVNSAQPDLLFTAVKALDSFLNNQSLVVLFTFQEKKLLFVGDAQAGNWEYWLYGGAPNKAPSVEQMTTEGRAILSSLDFYKVGHHGSTNATPITAVEAMGGNFASMCSTQEDSYGNPDKGTEVPRVPLLSALSKKSTVVRSDETKKPPAPERGRFEVDKNDLYVDYFL